MQVELIKVHGNEADICNYARVSAEKWVAEVGEGDARLIRYMARNGHKSPFYHSAMTLRITAPIFVARQLMRHHVGIVINEESRRYVDYEPSVYTPPHWRGRSDTRKQGSSEKTMPLDARFSELAATCVAYYKELIAAGVAPELARLILPQATYTQWICTANLYALINLCKERGGKDVQDETRVIAEQISEIVRARFPVSWEAWQNATPT